MTGRVAAARDRAPQRPVAVAPPCGHQRSYCGDAGAADCQQGLEDCCGCCQPAYDLVWDPAW